MHCIERAETPYQRIEVWKSAHQVEFRVQQAVHAWWHRQRFLTGLAWDNMIAACLLRPAGPPHSILMLGLAGGTTFRALRRLLPDVALTAVDIDGPCIDLARKHMHLDDLQCTIHIADAYQWIHQCRKTYDIVIDDVYLAGSHDVYRPGSWNEKNLLDLKKLVAPGGLLLTNLIRGAGHRNLQSQIRKLFREQFPSAKEVRTPCGLNETLCGGDAILGASALQQWREQFSSSRDRDLWDIISIRKLPKPIT